MICCIFGGGGGIGIPSYRKGAFIHVITPAIKGHFLSFFSQNRAPGRRQYHPAQSFILVIFPIGESESLAYRLAKDGATGRRGGCARDI